MKFNKFNKYSGASLLFCTAVTKYIICKHLNPFVWHRVIWHITFCILGTALSNRLVCACDCVNAGNYFHPMSLGQLTFLLNYLNALFQLAYQKKNILAIHPLMFHPLPLSLADWLALYLSLSSIHIQHFYSIIRIWCEAHQQILRCPSIHFCGNTFLYTHKER